MIIILLKLVEWLFEVFPRIKRQFHEFPGSKPTNNCLIRFNLRQLNENKRKYCLLYSSQCSICFLFTVNWTQKIIWDCKSWIQENSTMSPLIICNINILSRIKNDVYICFSLPLCTVIHKKLAPLKLNDKHVYFEWYLQSLAQVGH